MNSKLSIVTVFVPLARAGPAAGATWLAINATAQAVQARIPFIDLIYEAAPAGVQMRDEKSAAETAVARLRLETPARIGIDRRASARAKELPR